MTKALSKEIVVKMERGRYSYLMELDGDKGKDKWKNVSNSLDSAALHMGISRLKCGWLQHSTYLSAICPYCSLIKK